MTIKTFPPVIKGKLTEKKKNESSPLFLADNLEAKDS